MDKLYVFDFHRIFVGDAPLLFMFEIAFRTVIMYGYTVLLLRILGKRSMGQLSTLEVAIIISFGSAIGDPMMGSNVPVLHGMVAVTTVALLQIGIERMINRNRKLEIMMEGQPDCVVDNGLILTDVLRENDLSHEDLFRSLRTNQVEHLGEVKKAFFETSGNISVLFQSKHGIKQGLSVIPREMINKEAYLIGGDSIPETANYSCTNCGYTLMLHQNKLFSKCPGCNCCEWIRSS